MGGKPAARMGDSVVKGKIVTGSPTVLIGGAMDGIACEPCKIAAMKGCPVNPIMGIKVLPNETDIALPSPHGFHWFRFYSSDNLEAGILGPGWSTPVHLSIRVEEEQIVLIDAQGRSIIFSGHLHPSEERYSKSESIWIKRGGSGGPEGLNSPWQGIIAAGHEDPDAYFLTDGNGNYYRFGPRSPLTATSANDIRDTPQSAVPDDGKLFPTHHARQDYPDDATAPLGEYVIEGMFNRLGLVVRYHWSDGLLRTIIDSARRRYQLHYATIAGGIRLTHITLTSDPFGGLSCQTLISYGYSKVGDLIEVLDRYQQILRKFTYDKDHLLIAHEGLGIPRVDYTYRNGRVIKQVQSAGLTYTFDYHDNRTIVTDSLGRRETYHTAGSGGMKRLIRHDRADGSVILYDYDLAGRLAATHEGLVWLHEIPEAALAEPEKYPKYFRTTAQTLDYAGRLTSQTTIGGYSTRLTWNEARGLLTRITHPDGTTTDFNHDAYGRTISQTTPSGKTVLEYDDQTIDQQTILPPNPSRIIDPKGGVKHLTHTPLGQIASYTDCSGHTTHYHRDGWGLLTHITDATGQTSHVKRDTYGNVIESWTANGETIRYGYTEEGWIDTIEDSLHQTYRYRRDPNGLVIAIIQPDQSQIRFQYDQASRLTELINQNGVSHTFVYDAMDRLIQETTPDQRTIGYAYNPLSLLIERDDQGQKTAYQYDQANQLTDKHLVDNHIHFQWRHTKLIQARSDTDIVLDFQYDNANRLSKETLTIGDYSHTLNRQYDAIDQITQTRINDLPLDYLTYGSGHVYQIRTQDETLIDFEHDSLYRDTQRYLGGEEGLLKQTLTHDPAGRLLESIIMLRNQQTGTGYHESENISSREAREPPRVSRRLHLLREWSL